jgi:hypothetical protein
MDAKRKAILDRVESLAQAIRIAKEYLESGQHAVWPGFRPLFVRKLREGKELSPHKDWVRHVYLPRMEKALGRAERTLDRLSEKRQARSRLHAEQRRIARTDRAERSL